MRLYLQSAVLAAAAAIALGAPVSAQELVPPNERYCLEAPDVDVPLCRFATLEQCLQSRTSQADNCSLNPILAFRQRR